MPIFHPLLFLIFAAFAYAQEWPKAFEPNTELGKFKKLEEREGKYRYRTRHYVVETSEKLNPVLLGEFAKVAEAVAVVLEKIPLPLLAPPEEKLPVIRVVANEEQFMDLGGPVGAAGAYDGRRREVLIRGDQFFARSGQTTNFNLLVHELVHMQMHSSLWKCPQWFNEGVADYLVAAHQGKGEFNFTDIDRKIAAMLNKRRGAKEGDLVVSVLSEVAVLDFEGWRKEIMTKEGWEVMESYSSALLMVHYFFHGGERRRGELREYLKKIHEVEFKGDPIPTLLSAEQAEKIQPLLLKYWKAKGLSLSFGGK